MVDDNRKVGFKFKVTQEYEVTIYYEKGLIEDNVEEAEESICEDVIDLAFNEEGLVIKTDEESEHSNGYIAFVTTFDPTAEMQYYIHKIPKEIETELKNRKLLNGK